jgi:hypothetical protein
VNKSIHAIGSAKLGLAVSEADQNIVILLVTAIFPSFIILLLTISMSFVAWMKIYEFMVSLCSGHARADQ